MTLRCLLATCFIFLTAMVEAEGDWSANAVMDIEAAYQVALEDHPGGADERNPEFLTVAARARSDALSRAQLARNLIQYRQAVRSFFGPFADYHFQAYFPAGETRLPDQQWAGLVTVLDGERLTVVSAAEALLDLLGFHILSCDGQTPRSLYQERVQPYEARPNIQATLVQSASKIFLYRPGQFESRIKRCVFAGPNGQEERDLRWDFSTDEYAGLKSVALRGIRPKPSVREYQPNRWWIAASNFNPSTKDEQASIESMLNELRAAKTEIQNAEAIVIDIRGNGGGSSAYGDQIVDAIWGKDYRLSRTPQDQSFVEWRISKGNLAHMDRLVALVKERNFSSEVVQTFSQVRQGMITAAGRGETMYRQIEESDQEHSINSVQNPVAGSVYFLTNINCGSACLDFADVVLSLENVVQVGQPTTADSQYMEVRREKSPSGLATYVVPVKVYRDHIRPPRTAYMPQITYNGFDWTDAAVELWLDDIISQRLRLTDPAPNNP